MPVSAIQGQIDLVHVLLLVIYLLLIVVICNAVYNLYLHPLSQFPGPFFGRMTDFHHTFLLATRKASQKQWDLHQRYGKSEPDQHVIFHVDQVKVPYAVSLQIS